MVLKKGDAHGNSQSKKSPLASVSDSVLLPAFDALQPRKVKYVDNLTWVHKKKGTQGPCPFPASNIARYLSECRMLIHDSEQDNTTGGGRYEWIVIYRADVAFAKEVPPLSSYPSSRVTSHFRGNSKADPRIGDWFAVIPRNYSDTFLSLYENVYESKCVKLQSERSWTGWLSKNNIPWAIDYDVWIVLKRPDPVGPECIRWTYLKRFNVSGHDGTREYSACLELFANTSRFNNRDWGS